MSANSFRHVVALLDDNDEDSEAVLGRAVELADTERARLTLAQMSDPGWVVRWLSPLAPLCRMAPIADPEPEMTAGRRLARLAETVPASIPLCMILLPVDTARGLRQLAVRSPFDLVVVSAAQLAHGLRLGRELRRLEVCTLAVTAAGLGRPESRLSEPGNMILTST